MFNKLKSQKGITGIDLAISIIIITIFISIIGTLSINVSTSLASKRRLELATSCMTEIMEKVDSMDYSTIELISDYTPISKNLTYSGNSLRNEVKNILINNEEYDILTVEVKTEKYIPSDEQASAADLVKKVTVKITYKLNKNNETIEITRIKPRYNIDLENI